MEYMSSSEWQPLKIGEMLDGRYRIERFIAAGGQGAVYRASDSHLRQTVAIKCLRPEFAAGFLQVFRDEARIGRELRHEHICGVYDFRDDGASSYLVMEYVNGMPMNDFIRSQSHGKCSEGVFLHLAAQLLNALEYIHNRLYIHRDFRTKNILVTHECGIKVIDFGIASHIEETRGIIHELKSLSSHAIGCAVFDLRRRFSASRATRFETTLPITYRELGRDFTASATGKFELFEKNQIPFSFTGPLRRWAIDIHCLGCIFYEMLSGLKPFDIAEDCGMRFYPRPPAISGVDGRLNDIILACMMQDGLTPLQTVTNVQDAFNGDTPLLKTLNWWIDHCEY